MDLFYIIYNKVGLLSDLGEDAVNRLFIGPLDTLFYIMFPRGFKFLIIFFFLNGY